MRLVGGLVPRYLTPEEPPEVPAHAGTSDVDIVLNLQVIAEGEGYASLSDQLAARGFERAPNKEGRPTSWRWRVKVDEKTYVVVEFLRDAGADTPGRPVSIEGEQVSALSISFAGIVHDWYQERDISGQLLNGGGVVIEKIRFADVPAFVILKALALNSRHENKDAADLIHVLRYAGEIEDIADLFVQREVSQAYPGAVAAGLGALRLCFCDDEYAEGYQKVGPVAYAQFHFADDEEALVREQRYAAGLVQMLVDRIEEKLGALLPEEA